MRKARLIKDKPKFFFYCFIASGAIFYGQRKYSNSHFSHPLVLESIELLRKEKQIQELIGLPLNIRFSTSQNYNYKNSKEMHQAVFSFTIKGPKGTVEVEVQGQGLPIDSLDNQKLQEYFIPDEHIFTQLEDFQLKKSQDSLKSEQDLIQKKAKMWKINYLFADVGPNIRINLKINMDDDPNKAPEKSSKITEKNKLEQLLLEKKSEQVKQLSPQLENLSEQEMEERRQQRVQQMYSKVGFTRFVFIMAGSVGVAALYYYIMINKRKNLFNSQIYSDCVQIIKNSQQVRQYLGQGQNISINPTIRGQWVKDKADFQFDLFSQKGQATAYVKGFYDQESQEWNITQLNLKINPNFNSIDIKLK